MEHYSTALLLWTALERSCTSFCCAEHVYSKLLNGSVHLTAVGVPVRRTLDFRSESSQSVCTQLCVSATT